MFVLKGFIGFDKCAEGTGKQKGWVSLVIFHFGRYFLIIKKG